ncbi:Maltose fermentation regulatory protein MAL33 [Escovopsis weberi]|uniref:Maltose fermentation regulatory protein MAL33 n=1 Tax=Escovopsis weberi TaxID=150374 RepID=A0A0N0RTG1_ESCWE|nr:Maltose fermentation regulatory protein MAL33 [Escovopsis weberi]
MVVQSNGAVEDDGLNPNHEDPHHSIGDLPRQDADARLRESAVPAACLACRNKHLKCDGQSPCSRCINSNFECIYIASRRGYRGPRRGTAQNPNKRHATSPPEVGEDCPVMVAAGMSGTLPSNASIVPSVSSTPLSMSAYSPPNMMNAQSPLSYHGPTAPTQSQLYRSFCSVTSNDIAFHAENRAPQNPAPTLSERCINSFYQHFHSSHPFVLPKEHLLRLAKERPLEHLLATMRWVGSIFINLDSEHPRQNARQALCDDAYRQVFDPRQALYDDACRQVFDPRQTRDGFLVQAMMLLIVALDGNCQNTRSAEILGQTEALALEICLYTKQFATMHGMNNPVLEESWRRTWWDLFIIDGMIAGVHRVTNFLLFDVQATAALPCEEYQYLSGNIPTPPSLEDLENKEFSGDDQQFSSFAYRILCGRNLGKFMRTPTIWGPEDENLARIEALLTNWRLHLPEAKRDALQRDGRPDEMMFQAHMMMHATSILLHQPHSQLDSSPTKSVTSCAPYQIVPAGDLFNAHTKHTIASAAGISKLITHRVDLTAHTHFFTCCVTLSSIVHLNTWALFFVPHDDDNLRQQLSLNIGALHKLSQVWGAASRARGQVQGVAQEIYQIKKQQQRDPDYWLGFTEEQAMSSLATDDEILRTFIESEPHHSLTE